jgi:hypothetical protein
MARHTKPVLAEREGVTVNTVNNWIYRYGLPVIQIGARTYIDDGDFETWMSGHRKILTPAPQEEKLKVAIPPQCRKSGFLSKLRPAR